MFVLLRINLESVYTQRNGFWIATGSMRIGFYFENGTGSRMFSFDLTVFVVVPGRTVKPRTVQTGGVTSYDGECSSFICSSLFPVLRTGATTAALSFHPFQLLRRPGRANLPASLG